MHQHTESGLRIVRVDRVTHDEFPVTDAVESLADAEALARQETDQRKPCGDKFVVKDGLDKVIFDPSKQS